MKQITRLPFIVLFIIILLTFAAVHAEENTLTVLTYSSFSISEELIAQFENNNNIKVQFIESGDTPSVINRAILTKGSPIADIIIGINDVLLTRALSNDILEPYESPLLAKIDAQYQLDSSFRALPFDYGNVCINYDVDYFKTNGLPAPQSLKDLTNPQYAGLFVTENPASSAPGLAFFLATVAEFGEDGFVPYWNELIQNKTEIVPDWSTAYFTNFTAGGGDGHQPMVVSYDTSPAAAPFYSETPMEEAPTASVISDGTCYRVVEFLGIMKGTKHFEEAAKFVNAMLGKEWQEDLPGQMFVFPVNKEATLSDVFTKFAVSPQKPGTMDPVMVEQNFEKWLQIWTDQVLVNYK